jgi:hypothetical protein
MLHQGVSTQRKDNPFYPSWEESLVPDERAQLRPAQVVELKLISLLKGKAVPVSHMQMKSLLRQRS